MIADYKIRDACVDAYNKGINDAQTSIIEMLERNKLALTPEQLEVLKRESEYKKESHGFRR